MDPAADSWRPRAGVDLPHLELGGGTRWGVDAKPAAVRGAARHTGRPAVGQYRSEPAHDVIEACSSRHDARVLAVVQIRHLSVADNARFYAGADSLSGISKPPWESWSVTPEPHHPPSRVTMTTVSNVASRCRYTRAPQRANPDGARGVGTAPSFRMARVVVFGEYRVGPGGGPLALSHPTSASRGCRHRARSPAPGDPATTLDQPAA